MINSDPTKSLSWEKGMWQMEVALEKVLMATISRLGKKKEDPLELTQPLPVNALTLVSHLLQLTCFVYVFVF